MRSLQVLEEEVHPKLPIRAIFPVGRAEEVREGSQGVRGEQREQDPKRGGGGAAGGHGELAGVRGGGEAAGPGVRLHWRHCLPAA